jgi:hypothetical protein
MSRAIRRRHCQGMSTPHTSSKTQVLVIGAGPTGLVLGAQPLARGISTIGLAGNFIDQGHRVRRFRMSAEGRNLFNLRPSGHPTLAALIRHCVGWFLGEQDA